MPVSSNWLGAQRAYLLTVAAADLLWEAAHLPLYTLWQTGTPGEMLFAVVHCTLGDLLIALAAITLGSRRGRASRLAASPVRGGRCSHTCLRAWLHRVQRMAEHRGAEELGLFRSHARGVVVQS
jgi:hypothetical protein